jgi:hypothetical protein
LYKDKKEKMVFFLGREDAKDGKNEKAARNDKDDRNETEFF